VWCGRGRKQSADCGKSRSREGKSKVGREGGLGMIKGRKVKLYFYGVVCKGKKKQDYVAGAGGKG